MRSLKLLSSIVLMKVGLLTLVGCEVLPEPTTQLNHVILKLTPPLTQLDRDNLTNLGVVLLGRRSEGEYIAYLPDELAPDELGSFPTLANNTGISSMAFIPTRAQKKVFSDSVIASAPLFMVQTYRDVAEVDAKTAILNECSSCAVMTFGPTTYYLWVDALTLDKINGVADLDIVKRIHVPPTTMSLAVDNARVTIDSDSVVGAPVGAVDGSGIKVGVADQGPDLAHDTFQPCKDKVYTNKDDVTGDCIDSSMVGLDHGTFVASLIVGTGEGSTNKKYRGVAPGALLGQFPMTTVRYSDVAESQQQGTRVSNHSYKLNWASGDYNVESSDLDLLVKGSPMPPALASLKSQPQVWASGSVEDPLDPTRHLVSNQAKNPIIVAPIQSSTCGDRLDRCEREKIPAIGLTADGRIKPDFVAPGCDSQTGGMTVAKHKSGSDYFKQECAHSFATPIVTGVVALMMEKLELVNMGGFVNSASYKAILAQTAIDQVEVDDDSGAVSLQGPDAFFGWGLVDASGAVAQVENTALWQEGSLHEIGAVKPFCMSVPAMEEIKITLAWDDLPGEACRELTTTTGLDLCNEQSPKLVQDLDLVLVADSDPTNHILAWGLDNKEMKADKGDHLNNIELITMPQQEQTKDWTIFVRGNHIIASQPFGLTASHPITECQTEIRPSREFAAPPSPRVVPKPSESDPLLTLTDEPNTAVERSMDQLCDETKGCRPCERFQICSAKLFRLTALPPGTSVQVLYGKDRKLSKQIPVENGTATAVIPNHSWADQPVIRVTGERIPVRGMHGRDAFRIEYVDPRLMDGIKAQ